jgi:hypothetical protein
VVVGRADTPATHPRRQRFPSIRSVPGYTRADTSSTRSCWPVPIRGRGRIRPYETDHAQWTDYAVLSHPAQRSPGIGLRPIALRAGTLRSAQRDGLLENEGPLRRSQTTQRWRDERIQNHGVASYIEVDHAFYMYLAGIPPALSGLSQQSCSIPLSYSSRAA